MSTELTTKKQPTTLKEYFALESTTQQLAAALPTHITPDRMARVTMTAQIRNPKLTQCSLVSLVESVMNCAAIGLEPDGRRAHLVPYGKTCTMIVDYKGLVELVRRNGDVTKIHADVVGVNDEFEYDLGEVAKHKPNFKDRGEIIGAYAQVWFKSGEVKGEFMSVEEIEKIRQAAQGKNADPWTKHWNEMAKKTVFRRLTKWLTLSPEIRDAVDLIDQHEFRNVTPARQQEYREAANAFTQAEEPEPTQTDESTD